MSTDRPVFTPLKFRESNSYTLERSIAFLAVWDAEIELFRVMNDGQNDEQVMSMLAVYLRGHVRGESVGRTYLQFEIAKLLGLTMKVTP